MKNKMNMKNRKNIIVLLLAAIILGTSQAVPVYASVKNVKTSDLPQGEYLDSLFKELNAYYNSYEDIKPLENPMHILVVDKEGNRKMISDDFQYQIRLIKGRMVVSIYDIANVFDEKIYWFGKERIAVVGDIETHLDLDKKEMPSVIYVPLNKDIVQKDSERYRLDAPATIDPTTNRTYLPLRTIAELLGYKIIWDSNARTALLQEL